MKRRIAAYFVIAALASVMTTVATTQAVSQPTPLDPCKGQVEQGDVGIPYEGICVIVEPEKGPVQGVISHRSDDLLGDSFVRGLVVVHTDDGWKIMDDEFVQVIDGRMFANARVEDGWHIVLEGEPGDG